MIGIVLERVKGKIRWKSKCWFSHKVFKTYLPKVIIIQDNLEVLLYEPFPKQALVFTCLHYKSLKTLWEKREIARYEQFLLFPKCFL